jgi:hypothetical protein
MTKRGRPPIGDARITGAERNRRYLIKKLGEQVKRKAMTGAERQRKRSNLQKVAKIK